MGARHRLTATKVKNAPPGKYADGAGLWLVKRSDGGGQWVLRVTVNGKRREMGLGGIGDVSLSEARDKAEKWRKLAKDGQDPIRVRVAERRAANRSDTSFKSIGEKAFEARKAELKGDGTAGRWFSPIELHVLPKLGRIEVEQLDARDIQETLKPLWHTKADTARKAINRINVILKYGAAMGLNVDIQAAQKAKALLGKTRQVRGNIPSMPWKEVPAFYKTLEEPSITHLALRFLILTATRSSEVRFFSLSELEGNVWVIPAERMKAGQEHRVPLSKEAHAVIELAKPFEREGFLFPSARKGVISDATMSGYMKRNGFEARPHGFRSSFRTWCAEATDTPREIAEVALSHKSGTDVELAYRRTDFLEQRRVLMERWADHVTGGAGQVLRLAK